MVSGVAGALRAGRGWQYLGAAPVCSVSATGQKAGIKPPPSRELKPERLYKKTLDKPEIGAIFRG